MAGVYKKLFLYQSIHEVNGEIVFLDARLHKIFPDNEFVIGNSSFCMIIDPIKSTVCIQRDDDNMRSKSVGIEDWMSSDGMSRTD